MDVGRWLHCHCCPEVILGQEGFCTSQIQGHFVSATLSREVHMELPLVELRSSIQWFLDPRAGKILRGAAVYVRRISLFPPACNTSLAFVYIESPLRRT